MAEGGPDLFGGILSGAMAGNHSVWPQRLEPSDGSIHPLGACVQQMEAADDRSYSRIWIQPENMVQSVYQTGVAAADTDDEPCRRPNPDGQVVRNRVRALSLRIQVERPPGSSKPVSRGMGPVMPTRSASRTGC